MDGQEYNNRRRCRAAGHWSLHEMCDDDIAAGDLPKDLGILRTVHRYNQVTAGVYASVYRGGTIRRGDRVRL